MLRIVVCLLALVSAARASAEQFTLLQAVTISTAISTIGCTNKIIRDGAKESFVCEPYEIKPGIAWQIATIKRLIEPFFLQYQRQHNEQLKGLSRKSDGEPTAEAQAALAVFDMNLQNEKIDIELPHLKKAETEGFKLSPSVISALMPIIDEK